MTVIKILKLAATMLQLKNIEENFNIFSNSSSLLNNIDETQDENKLLCCYNLVVSELSEEYLPIKKTQTFENQNGKIYFSSFSEIPLEIKACFVNGEEVSFSVNQLFLETKIGNVTVVYEFYPQEANFSDDCPYSNTKISSRIIALGVVKEYLLLTGQYEEALVYDGKFRQALSSVLISKKLEKIRARGWY